MANSYPDIILSLSAGNEACVDWTDHYVPVESVIKYVRMIKEEAKQPVTFCENYLPWLDKLRELVKEVDFISIHTYPVWEYKNIHEAMEYTKQNYYAVADTYPNIPVVITEAGWTTYSNGRGICPSNVSEEYQKIYYNDLVNWSEENGILTFVFEAFDEPWKGSGEALEPEKHWGLFTVDRKPKIVMKELYSEKLVEPVNSMYKMNDWTKVDAEGNINVPDYLVPLIHNFEAQMRLYKIKGKTKLKPYVIWSI